MIIFNIFISILFLIKNTKNNHNKIKVNKEKINSDNDSNSEELCFVFEYSRHGTRSPSANTFDNKTGKYLDYFNFTWDGRGELTPVGMRQHYILGIRNRLKYANFLDFSHFNHLEILVASTLLNRTIESAYSQLLGMFPPGTGPQITKDQINLSYPPNNLNKEVINEVKELNFNALKNQSNIFPVYFYDSDYLFLNEKYCTNYNKIQLEAYKKAKVFEYIDEFKNKYQEKINEFLNSNNIKYDFTFVFRFTDNFLVNIGNGIDMQNFYNIVKVSKETFREECIKFKKLVLYDFYDTDPSMIYYYSSRFFRILLSYMENRKNNYDIKSYSIPKMVIYIGQDATMNIIEFCMHKIFNIKYGMPDFGSNIYFELYKNKFNVNVKYYIDDVITLNIDYETFKENIERNLKSDDDINEFCGNKIEKNDDDNNNKNKDKIIILLCVIIFILIIALIIFIFKYKKFKKKFTYLDINKSVKKTSLLYEYKNK